MKSQNKNDRYVSFVAIIDSKQEHEYVQLWYDNNLDLLNSSSCATQFATILVYMNNDGWVLMIIMSLTDI